MATIKCIGCLKLRREERKITGQILVVYDCSRFPYATVISGLLRPGKGILTAATACSKDPLGHCILCSETKVTHYGEDIAASCPEHYQAWSKWLNEHPERHGHLAPRGRSIKANWVEVFREFIEDMRPEPAEKE